MVDHCDDELLSLVALEESAATSEALTHLTQCPLCAARLAELSSVVMTARSISESDQLVDPPADLWGRIAQEVGLAPESNVRELKSRRPRLVFLLAGAAAVGLVLGGLGTSLLVGRDGSNSGAIDGATIVASAELAPMSTVAVTGSASIEQRADSRVLTVDVSELPATDGYYEVWLATADTKTMVAMGILSAGQHGEYPLPPAMDMAAYPVVDVSVEHFDGNPEHGTESLVRGTLQG
jgi:anti-sigma factor RsiW